MSVLLIVCTAARIGEDRKMIASGGDVLGVKLPIAHHDAVWHAAWSAMILR
jgi:hypothetical protein